MFAVIEASFDLYVITIHSHYTHGVVEIHYAGLNTIWLGKKKNKKTCRYMICIWQDRNVT